jgi:hypothetical protein
MIRGHHAERRRSAAEGLRGSPGRESGLELLDVVRCVGVRLRERLAAQLCRGGRGVQGEQRAQPSDE